MKNQIKSLGNPHLKAKRFLFGKLIFCASIFALTILFQFWVDRQNTPGLSFGTSVSSANPLGAAKDKRDNAIDVNTADLKALSALPGIGQKLAESILKDREANGAYMKPADLLRVKGIGEKTLEKITPFLRFDALKK